MALTPTRGSTLITRSNGTKGGQYIDVSQAEIDFVNSEGLILWVDGKALVSGSTTALRDRFGSIVGAVENGPTRAVSGGTKDNVGWVWPATPDSGQRLAFPGFVLPQDYAISFVLNPSNGTTASSIRTLAYELPSGEYLASWLSQAAIDTPLDLRWRHGGAGGLDLAGAVPYGVRSILTVYYDAARTRLSAFLGKTLLGSITENAKDVATGLWFGGRPGTTTPTQKFYGMIESVAVFSGVELYSTDAEATANTRRNALIERYAAVYGLTV